MEYAGFWKRFGAYWIDVIVFIPIIALSSWGAGQSRLFSVYYFIPGLIIGLWFHVYSVKRYGGTPGKLLLKIKIAKLDGSDVEYMEALLRHCVLFILSTAMSVAMLLVTIEMTDAQYFALDWNTRAEYMIQNAPAWYGLVTILVNVWVWSEFIVMLTNKKRSTIHDFMAGTVLIRR